MGWGDDKACLTTLTGVCNPGRGSEAELVTGTKTKPRNQAMLAPHK